MSRVDVELSAMQAIANTLAALPDNEARARVLRWAADHFEADVTPDVLHVELAPPAGSSSEGDPLNLESIFDDGIAPSFITKAPKRRSAKPPVVTALHNFVVDFQKLARDWQSA